MSENNGYTPTERRMLDILDDGLPHRREELHACLGDELAPLSAIQNHISRLRAKLKPKGHDVLCVSRDNTRYYQRVVLYASANDGRY